MKKIGMVSEVKNKSKFVLSTMYIVCLVVKRKGKCQQVSRWNKILLLPGMNEC